jgi:nucleotide-binding universal stress UspA family protein
LELRAVSYRTILTHLNDSRRARRLLDFAAELARAFEARVIGLHVSARLRLQAMASPLRHIDVLSSLKFTLDEEADHLRSIFENAASRQRFTGEFRCLTAERVNPSGIVLARARAADLIVASQTDPQWALSPLLDCSDDLAIGSGRPVIVVPNDRECVALPNKAIIAWNQSRESTRAIFDALPLLKGARAVELLTFDEVDKEGRADLQLDQEVLPASAVADVLMGHGIKSTIATVKAPGIKVGDEICARAAGERADLIVMGAYGHTRLRELVFGGATRHVLKHMPVPVLFSH